MITPPAVFGHEFSGTVAAVGTRVKNFRAGMRVVANNSAPCYRCYYCRRNLPNLCDDLLFINGAYAEYIVVPERVVHTNLLELPASLPYTVACLTEPLACVLHCLDQAKLYPGDTVVVNGDGPSGLMLAAMAAWRGARVILCDVMRGKLPRLPDASVVVADPPWYPEHLRNFLWTSAVLLRPGGRLYVCLPAAGTRPGPIWKRRRRVLGRAARRRART